MVGSDWPSGRVITNGERGKPGEDGSTVEQGCLPSPELYDPAGGTFNPVGGNRFTGCRAEATLLNNGNVLITTGNARAELFDPLTGTFRTAPVMRASRTFRTITLLRSEEVLITGGSVTSSAYPHPPLASVELYDPATRTFSEVDSMREARFEHTATLLSDGTVLVIGGKQVGGIQISSAEIWIPPNL